MNDFEPDVGYFFGAESEGMGKIYEKEAITIYRWAGMPGNVIPDDLGHQFVEFETLLDNEFDELINDRAMWLLRRSMPRNFDLLKPLADLPQMDSFIPVGNIVHLAMYFSRPDVQEMCKGMAELGGQYMEYFGNLGAMAMELETSGFPVLIQNFGNCPFDEYSCFLRGTIQTCLDTIERDEELDKILERQSQAQLASIAAMPNAPGKIWVTTLTKGSDTFMSDEDFDRYYWKYLKPLIDAVVEKEMTPYLYGEGCYDSRLKYFEQLPKGKCILHIEKTEKLQEYKDRLKDVCALAGAYPVSLLERGTEQQCVDKFKEIFDILGKDGGYIFDTDCSLEKAKPENVKALFDCIKEYGKY